MTIQINRIKASIKFNTIYKCIKCGKSKIGDTQSIECNCSSTDKLKTFINFQRQTPQYMPVGWSSNLSGFTCQTCNL